MITLVLPLLLLAAPAAKPAATPAKPAAPAAKPAAPAASAPASPLAPAAQGKVECYSPDMAKKTCRSMAAYRPTPEGGFANLAIVLLMEKPPVIMQMTSPVTIKNGQVCGPVRNADIDGAKFEAGGSAMTLEETANLRNQVRTQMADVIGKEVCTAYLPSKTAGAKTARAFYNGVAQPKLDQLVIWVTREDGFRVAP